MLFVDAGNGRVGIGSGAPFARLHIANNGGSTDRNDSHIKLQNTNNTTGDKAFIVSQFSTTGGATYNPVAFGAQNTQAVSRYGAFVVHVADVDEVDYTTDERFRISSNNGAVFNEGSLDTDFRVESDSNANMLFVDAGNDRVGINNSSPTHTLTVEGVPHISNAGFAFHTVDKAVSSGSVTFSYAETTTTIDNFTGLVIICIYNPSTTQTRHAASYVGLRMIGRGAGGSITEISKVQDSGITTFTVATSGDSIVVTTDSSPTLRCRLIVLGGGGISVPPE